MKQGLQFHLAVKFDTDLNKVKKIEFLFSKRIGAPSQKKEEYLDSGLGTVKRDPIDPNVLLVPFTREETYKFKGELYLDTRITFNYTNDQPETPIVKLEMNDTLFKKEDENK